MQTVRKKPLQVKNICALIFCFSIIILGMICCGYGRNFSVTSSSSLPRLSSGQCKGNNVAPVAGEQTLAVATQEGLNVTICIFRAKDGRLLRHYDLTTYGSILGSGDGLLYTREYSNSSTLCAIQISDGIERWCQSQQNAFHFIIAGNGNVYTTSYSTNGQILITAFSEHDGRTLWAAPTSIATSENQLLLATGPGAVYSYRTISVTSPAPGTSFTSGVNGVCALRARDGRQLWCSPLANQQITGMVVDENSLYVRNVGDYPSISAIDTANGAIRWTAPVNQEDPTGTSSLLTLTNGILFTNTANLDSSSDQLYALRTSDGKQLWSVSQPEWITAVTATDKDVYVVARSGTLHVLNILNGKAAWSYKPSLKGTQEPYNSYTNDNNNASTIFVEHNIAYMLISANSYGHLIALNARDGAPLWQTQECNYSTATLTASPDAASNQKTTGRCYWVNDSDTGSGNMQLSLLEVDN